MLLDDPCSTQNAGEPGLDPEVVADLAEGHFDLPTPDVPGQDLQRLAGGIGAQQRLRIKATQGIAQQNPADRHDRQPGMAPHGGGGAELDEAIALAIPTRHAHALPPEPVEGALSPP
jgi:hypothetical protein